MKVLKQTLKFLCFCAAIFCGQFVVATDWALMPYPKQIEEIDGVFVFTDALELRVPAKEQKLLEPILLEEWKRAMLPLPKIVPVENEEPQLLICPTNTTPEIPELPKIADEKKIDVGESYSIAITKNGIVCRGGKSKGLYYAVLTLCQLIRANRIENNSLQCMTIYDFPSIKYRCFQDDLTRGPSPHLETLLFETNLGSQLKHNMMTYYMENQYEFKKHPKISPPNGSLLQEEFKEWIAFASARHLTILGNQQSFAHFRKILSLPEYKHLGEAGYILSPVVEEVYPFLDELYSEIIPYLPFEMFNVCCDETWDLAATGKSKELADKIGVGGVYVQHILRVRELLKKYDKRMMMWGDIIIKHPDQLKLIPKDVVMMCWDYEPRPDFKKFIQPFSDSGYEFFVCPGQSNWSEILPRIDKYTVNIQNFIRDGYELGAIGALNTGWEDDGESIHGYNWHAIAWGAECSWNASKTKITDFNKRIGKILFGTKNDDFGQAIELLQKLQASHVLDNRNRRFWKRDFLPDAKPDIVKKNAETILNLVRPSIELLEKTKQEATINKHLLDSFLLGARRMELIALRMLDGLELSQRKATLKTWDFTDPQKKQEGVLELEQLEKIIEKNRNAHTAIKNEFVRIWNSESKPYSLKPITDRYDSLDAWFADLQTQIRHSRIDFVEGKTTSPFDVKLVKSLTTNKPVTCSEFLNEMNPEKANDGIIDSDSYWACDVSKKESKEAWWQVDFEKPETVGNIVVIGYFGDNRSYGFYVEGSLDGTNWTMLSDKRNNKERSTASGYNCEFSPQKIRYLRVTQTSNTANSGRHLVEVLAF
ncbi:MAG: discoidin domain-containing protein [Planctomycetaceae bacterium]|nr:discoidin domain-containing protein [Planctomycetaceae bacterium]